MPPLTATRWSREWVGWLSYHAASILFLLSAALLVWRRNRFIDFGVYVPTVKPSDPLLLLVLFFVFLALISSKTLRREAAENALLIYWAKCIALFFLFLAAGSLWSFLFLGQAPAVIDALQYGRIAWGTGFFLLVIFFGFRNERYLKALALSFLVALAMAPIIFLSEEIIVSNYLIVSPASYTLHAFQPGTVFLGSYLVFPIAVLFSLFLLGQRYKKIAYLAGTILLTALVLWTGSRAAWLSVLAVFLTAVAVYGYWRRENKVIVMYCLSVVLIFLSGFFILPTLARNTVLTRVFPNLQADVHLRKEILEKIPALREGLTLDQIWWLSLRLPTRYYFNIREPRVDLKFGAGRGELWKDYAVEAVFHPMGLGPSYASVLRDLGTDRFVQTRAFKILGGTHNLWLQVLLSAGIGGLAIFAFAIGKLAKGVLNLVRSDRAVTTLWVAGGFAGILVDSFFFDSLELRWFWVILGIVVVACGNHAAASLKNDVSR